VGCVSIGGQCVCLPKQSGEEVEVVVVVVSTEEEGQRDCPMRALNFG
jgi:hypothetical protein